MPGIAVLVHREKFVPCLSRYAGYLPCDVAIKGTFVLS